MEVRVDRGAREERKSRSRVTQSKGTDAGTRGEGSGAGPVHSRRAGKTHVAATATAITPIDSESFSERLKSPSGECFHND